jgi:hypothetical protein
MQERNKEVDKIYLSRFDKGVEGSNNEYIRGDW